MNLYENFKPRCNITEANELAKQVPFNIPVAAYDCYCQAYIACESNETVVKQNVALGSVYMLGFLSGSRAIRERRKQKE